MQSEVSPRFRRMACNTLLGMMALLTVSGACAPDAAAETTLRIHLTARNPHPHTLQGAIVRFFAPIASAAEHELIKAEVNHPYQTEVDAYGNRAIVIALADLAPYSLRPISMTFTVRDKPASQAVNAPPAAYVSEEALIESTDPEIVALSQQLAGRTPVEVARNAQQWIVDNLNYAGYQPFEAGALAALRMRRGDCTEYAYLFAALMRARGIPARVLGGYVAPSSRIVKPLEYHNWVEFHAEGKWQLADPQRNVFMKDTGDYIAMRIVVRGKNMPASPYPHRFSVDSNEVELLME